MIQFNLGEAEENAFRNQGQYITQGRVTEAMMITALLGPGNTVTAEPCIPISMWQGQNMVLFPKTQNMRQN